LFILNRSLAREVWGTKINNISTWNGLLLITLLCRLRSRQWLQNMETGETILGGPKTVYLTFVKLNIVGFPVPGQPREMKFKAVQMRMLLTSTVRERLRVRERDVVS